MRTRAFLAVVTLLAVAMLGCGDESGSPSGPQGSIVGGQPAFLLQKSCEETYLEDLSPVLQQWEGALETLISAETLDSPPVYGENSTPSEYLTALSPVLAQWESVLEDSIGDDILDTPPAFPDGDKTVSEYLLELSPILLQWESALEAFADDDILNTPPTFTEDTEPPVVSCVGDTTADCTSPGGAIIEFEATAVDDCDPEPTVTCDPPSGTLFPFGETIVTCTAVDSADNESQCTFTVTVQDTTLPTIECPSDTTLECVGGDGAVLEYTVTASDACDDTLDVICDPESGSTFPIGSTTVTCTATDSSGNVSECSFDVIVEDTTPPTIECPGDTTLECTGDGGALVEYTVEASDLCDSEPSIDCDWPSGSIFPLGETLVTCTATDAAGNETECTFTVKVQDTTPPTVHGVSASPNELWSPNHKMVNVTIVVDADDVCGVVTCKIVRVSSNEDTNGRGDGNTEPDWEITDDLTLKLRAERSGRGSGRVYTIDVECSDPTGNMVQRSVEVTVAHDRGNGASARF